MLLLTIPEKNPIIGNGVCQSRGGSPASSRRLDHGGLSRQDKPGRFQVVVDRISRALHVVLPDMHLPPGDGLLQPLAVFLYHRLQRL